MLGIGHIKAEFLEILAYVPFMQRRREMASTNQSFALAFHYVFNGLPYQNHIK